MPTEVLVFRHPDEFSEDVRQLFALGERDGIALGIAWYRNLLATVAHPKDAVRFYVLRRCDRAVAALPVIARPGSLPFHHTVESLANYYTALYAPVLDPQLDAQGLAPLIHAIKRAHAPMSNLRLQPMDSQASGYGVLMQSLRLAGLLPFDFHCFGNWFLRGHADWPDYLARRTSKLRSNIKRAEKRLADEGGSIEILVDRADAPRAIDAYQQVYAASWKKEEPYAHFVPGLIATCAERGWLRLGLARLHGQAIAAQLWIVANARAEIYKVAYNEAFKEYSPGTVLTARLMQHVIERDKVLEVDYLMGDDPYKKLWMSERRERRGVVAYNPRNLGGAIGAAREASGRTVRTALERLKAREGERSAA